MENNIFTGMTFTDEPELVAEGEYEFVIDSADKKKSKSGTTNYLALKFKIRGDVDQANKGRCLVVNVFKDKDNPQWYDYNTLKRIIATQKTVQPNGAKWSVSFETPDDCIQYLIGLKMRATVAHETYEDATGDEVERAVIVRGSYKPTEHKESPIAVTVSPSGTTTTVSEPSLSDNDLPF